METTIDITRCKRLRGEREKERASKDSCSGGGGTEGGSSGQQGGKTHERTIGDVVQVQRDKLVLIMVVVRGQAGGTQGIRLVRVRHRRERQQRLQW